MQTEAEAFLQRIRAYPDDDTPRLIFADWLDEQDCGRGERLGPEWNGERARFIRIQIALARLTKESIENDHGDSPESNYQGQRDELLAAEQALLSTYETEWTAPFRGLATGLEFRRGFVEVAKVAARQFLRFSHELFATGPIRHLHMLDLGGSLTSTFQSHFLARLSSLTIHAQHLGEPLTRAVADCRYLSELKSLRLSRNRLEDAAVDYLAGSSFLNNLEELDLSENDLGETAGRSLAASPCLSSLKQLELGGNRLGPAGVVAITSSDRLTSLTRLGLAGNEIGSPRLYTLAEPHALLRVPEIDLSANDLNASYLRVIFAAPSETDSPPRVRELDLSHNNIGDEGARVIAASPSLKGLRVLRLVGCGIGDRGTCYLAESPHLAELRELYLENNPITDAGLRHLITSPNLGNLRHLGMPRLGISVTIQRLLVNRLLRRRK